jgi:hypothetical protein
VAPVKVLGIAQEAAESALVRLARHVAAEAEIGRPLLAQPDDGAVLLATDLCWWWVDDSEAMRLLPLSGGRAELTIFRDGAEVSRTLGAAG